MVTSRRRVLTKSKLLINSINLHNLAVCIIRMQIMLLKSVCVSKDMHRHHCLYLIHTYNLHRWLKFEKNVNTKKYTKSITNSRYLIYQDYKNLVLNPLSNFDVMLVCNGYLNNNFLYLGLWLL